MSPDYNAFSGAVPKGRKQQCGLLISRFPRASPLRLSQLDSGLSQYPQLLEQAAPSRAVLKILDVSPRTWVIQLDQIPGGRATTVNRSHQLDQLARFDAPASSTADTT